MIDSISIALKTDKKNKPINISIVISSSCITFFLLVVLLLYCISISYSAIDVQALHYRATSNDNQSIITIKRPN